MGLIREKCLSGIGTDGVRSSDSTESRLKPAIGMNASVTMLLEVREDVLIVPSQAIQIESNGDVVTIIDRDATTNIPVTIGIANGDQTEITSGLEEGQVVLVPSGSDSSAMGSSSSNRPSNVPGDGGTPR